VAMENREEKLDAIYDMIEKDLSLVGRTTRPFHDNSALRNTVPVPYRYMLNTVSN
jgi:hypothetical protein